LIKKNPLCCTEIEQSANRGGNQGSIGDVGTERRGFPGFWKQRGNLAWFKGLQAVINKWTELTHPINDKSKKIKAYKAFADASPIKF
jgi:hypothetical protein